MKNRKWFLNTATIDRLMQMNKRLINTDKGVCILNSLVSDEDDVLTYCAAHYCDGKEACFYCLQDFLNNEHES
jgi:uncharacterized protein (DUF779 family)